MENMKVANKDVTLYHGSQSINLTLRPVTFARFSEITTALDGKTVDKVLIDPTPFEVAKIAYCLLTEDSKARLKDVKIQLDNKQYDMNEAGKLYCFMSETGVNEGHTNLVILSAVINKLFIDSFPEQDKKKVRQMIMKKVWHWMLRSFMILLLILTVVILTLHFSNK